MLLIKSAALSDIGRCREKNEDSFYLCGVINEVGEPHRACSDDTPRESYLFAVCDGIGGQAYGERASNIAVNMLSEYADSFNVRAEEYFEAANKRICSEIRACGSRMGTTFAGLWVKDGVAGAYNIGDSRVYLLRNGKLLRLSKDHTQAELMCEQGVISRAEIKTHPFRHRLTQHLGIFPQEADIDPHAVVNITLREGDTFILCTDGLTDALGDEELQYNILASHSPTAICGNLYGKACENGTRDNVTIIIVRVEKASEDEEELYYFMKNYNELEM